MSKASAIFTADGRMNTKRRRLLDCKKQSYAANLPPTYKLNSTKEELCFEYVNSFTKQFSSIYPHRKTPFMLADNEIGVKKFVCSTLRPSQVPYQELYDLYECASFLAGYMIYEPLDPPNSVPTTICSPTYSFSNNIGDCFELATVLCSFLLGAGYDAYVVNGYAPKYITLKDQSNTMCPLIGSSSAAATSNEAKKDDSADQATSNYVPIDNSAKSSQYLQHIQEQQKLAMRDNFELWIADSPEIQNTEEEVPSPDMIPSIHGPPKKTKGKNSNNMLKTPDMLKYLNPDRLVHSWVVIRSGKREVREHLFVEPSTGRVYPIQNSPYFCIESIWNHENYWINLDVFKRPSHMDFDLQNNKLWESLFLSNLMKKQKNNEAQMNGDQDNENDLFEEGKESSSESKADLTVARSFDAPPSWVEALTFERKQFLLRFPPLGRRTIHYFCAKADFFAKTVNDQSIVMRITLYLDKACTIVKEVHEWFENRKDKLYKRSRFYLGQRHFIEYYHPGSQGEVKQWKEFPGKTIEIDFYVDGRLDRMKRREETIGKRVVEYFSGRTDLLSFRSVDFSVSKPPEGSRLTLPGGGLATELHITQMVQLFDRDPNVTPGEDVAKRTFFVREGKSVTQYHFATQKVTGKVKTHIHTKAPGTPALSDLALSQEEGLDDNVDALQEAATLERECYTAIKLSFQQIQKIVDFRMEIESHVDHEKTVFELALDRAQEQSQSTGAVTSVDKTQENVAKTMDYLTPFLRHVKDVKNISREEALEVRQNCLDALRSRLVERANIIQTRLNEENAKLGRKQEQFQRSQRDGDLSTEEYEKYCTEAMFRIQILEQRLVAHEEAALKKYAELDAKLASDPRLKVLRV